MTKDIKSRPFKYIWRDLVMKIPHNSKAGSYKAFAYAIVEFMHGDAVTCYPGLDKLAAESGMSPRTASTAGDAFDASEWIIRAVGGKGGKGDSTEYALRIPCNMLHALDADTMQAYAAYHAKLASLPCKMDPDTMQLLACELKNHLKTIDNQNAGVGQIEGKKEREQIPSPSLDPSNETERESEPYSETSSTSPIDTARASLPVATAEQRAAWGEAWPTSDAMLKRIAEWENAYKLVGTEALRVLNITFEDAAMPEGSEHRFMDGHINASLSDDHRRALAGLLQRGECRHIDMANVLATYGFSPKAKKQQEALNEAVA